MQGVRETLEARQVAIYFAAILLAAGSALIFPAPRLARLIEPALAVMLFATFLQVPLAELPASLLRGRFMAALLVANFIMVPLVVLGLFRFLPPEPMLRLGVLMVLLAPCIDYVVTFSQIGRADARSLLAATPVLLIVQMALLPVFLGLFLGPEAGALVAPGPFLHAFVWLIGVPLLLAALVQVAAARSQPAARLRARLDLLPVPATALVLFLVFAGVLPQLGLAFSTALSAVPFYIAFAVIAPIGGWLVARAFRLRAPDARAIAFSAATRNSLVILPLAFAVPGAVPLLPAVIVAQTVVELVSSLIYMKVMPRVGRDLPAAANS